jgi:hypothetical protein
VPGKWLAAELILMLCVKGIQVTKQDENIELIKKLQSTKFFKNGVLIVSGSQIIHWIRVNNSISSGLQAIVGNKNNGIINTWENLLLNLIENDIEKNKGLSGNQSEIEIQHEDFGAVLEEIGNEPEKLFLYFLLGLMEVSPSINDVIRQVCAKVQESKIIKEREKKTNSKKVLNERGSLFR